MLAPTSHRFHIGRRGVMAHAGRHVAARSCVLLGLGLGFSAAPAIVQAQETPGEAVRAQPADTQISVRSAWRAGADLGSSGLQPESSLWLQRGDAGVGLGWRRDVVDPAAMALMPPGLPGAPGQFFPSGGTPNALASTRLTLGFSLNAGPRTSVIVDTPVWADSSNELLGNVRPIRVGLVLTPADPLAGLRRGQLTRFEFSAHSQLSLRTRSGGLTLSYTRRF